MPGRPENNVKISQGVCGGSVCVRVCASNQHNAMLA